MHETIGSRSTLSITNPDTLHQWKKVFRLQAGNRVILFDGSGKEYECTIEMLSKEKAEVAVGDSKEVPAPPREVWLCVALIKKDNFEWVAQKATELGVSHIVPILAERSEKKDLNVERLEKIVIEASEQSGRGTLPYIHKALSPEDALTLCAETRFFVFDPSGTSLQDTEKHGSGSVSLFVGPEGGWSDAELAFFSTRSAEVRTLGTYILRAETAAVVSSALFLVA